MKTVNTENHKNLLYILLSVFLLVFAKSWEPGLGVSSTTYGVFAKNILTTGNWFHFSLGPGLYEPFVDHPYLTLWLDALAFKFFGISAQSIRIVASISGILSVAAIYGTLKELTNEKHATYTYVVLLTVTVFFNFMSSGWMDMPMIAFTLGGFYFAVLSEKRVSISWILFAGISLAAAFLTKGIGALGIIPIIGYIFARNIRRPLFLLFFAVGSLTPIMLFTILHYHYEGFFFWSAYLNRQFGQNNPALSVASRFWYIEGLIDKALLTLILFPFGLKKLWKDQRALALLIVAQVVLHLAVYSASSRQYTQYILPVIPWLTMAAGYYLATILTKWNTRVVTKSLAAVSIAYFVLVDILPIRVHAGSDNPYRSFTPIVSKMAETKEILFLGTMDNQDVWEIYGSYISWYYDKTPRLISPDSFIAELRNNPSSVAIVSPEDYQKYRQAATESSHKACAWNEELVLLATEKICPAELQSYRPIEDKRQVFAR